MRTSYILCIIAIVASYQSIKPIKVEILTEISVNADKNQVFKFLCNLTKLLEQEENRKVDFIGSVLDTETSISRDQYHIEEEIHIFGILRFTVKYDAYLSKFHKNFTISTTFEVGLVEGNTTWTLHDGMKNDSQVTTNLNENFTATCPWILSHIIQMVATKEHRHILQSLKERLDGVVE